MYVVNMPRKPKGKRDEIKVTYRLAPAVKNGIITTAEITKRSENLHAEYLLMLGLLAIAGIDTTKLTPQEVDSKFTEIYEAEEEVA